MRQTTRNLLVGGTGVLILALADVIALNDVYQSSKLRRAEINRINTIIEQYYPNYDDRYIVGGPDVDAVNIDVLLKKRESYRD